MSTVRMLSNLINQIPAEIKKDILKGALSGGSFGVVGGVMATHPTTENRCQKVFTAGVEGILVGALTGSIARKSFTKLAEYANKKPGNTSINIYNLYSAKVAGFLVGHRSAKNSSDEESSNEVSASFKI